MKYTPKSAPKKPGEDVIEDYCALFCQDAEWELVPSKETKKTPFEKATTIGQLCDLTPKEEKNDT